MIKKCIICNKEFEAKRNDAKCCSATCRSVASRTNATDKLSVAEVKIAADVLKDSEQEVNVREMTKDDLYFNINMYSSDTWKDSPEFAELMRRLNTWKLDRLKADGYFIPNRYER